MTDKKIVRAKDIMRVGASLVNSRETVSTVIDKMMADQTHLIIVDKHDEDDEYGLVRLSDIANQVLSPDKSPDRVNVYEVMSKPALCIPDRMDIRHCARLFDRFNIHAAPVVDPNGHILGVISYEDLVLKGLAAGK